MVCHVHVGMQGRIDATRLFNNRLSKILDKCGMLKCLWDKQVFIYHNSKLKGSDASLSDILTCIKTSKDTEAQQPPVGYCVIGWHVDDGIGVACGVNWETDPMKNRVIAFIQGQVQQVYATTLTGWHGNKALGFLLQLNESDQSVTMSAPDTIKQLGKVLLDGAVNISPKHITNKDFYDIPPGELPASDDPTYESAKAEAALVRHGLGVMIWAHNAHMEAAAPTNLLCANMHSPNVLTGKCLRYMIMYLLNNLEGVRYGGHGTFGLEQTPSTESSDAQTSSPLDGKRHMHLHWFSDASLNTTGGVGMLAGGAIVATSQRQHLAAPDSHSSEVVAAGTNFSILVPVTGLLQELSIALGDPVPFYLDSLSTVYVATSDTSIRKSAWLIRRLRPKLSSRTRPLD